jgi:gliding motility-associated-like protein
VLPAIGIFDAMPPNVITPNGDHLNDRFAPHLSRSGSVTDCEAGAFRQLRIFSRWGREIFRTTDEAAGWDGANASAGTYYYLLEYTNRPYVKGWLELIR